MNLLVVEDEARMLELLRRGLGEEGHSVTCAPDGEEGLQLARTYPFDVVILDVMMPKLDGFQMLQRMRSARVPTPVLVLTAKDTVPDVVRGLDLGADDYLTKPFSFTELLARLRAVQRRAHRLQNPMLRVSDLTLDPSTREVSRAGLSIYLTRTEYNLLERLMYRVGKVAERRALIEAVWGFDRDIEENTLDAFMHLLRSKIDKPEQPKLIYTVRGVGYVIREASQL
ncbi:Response regulator MprA [Candidatus Sulfotelmatobacter kueseliae]|uniref:Response regulator MprA n=1 Tax=Candidatus Sulfotelmatobacter kueseliae TaxID=2042962 RepID=A0A2U3KRX0_9BACT|nr:Response regulator MprA [Candidatus Sulfotelmatobacter kueseliae]